MARTNESAFTIQQFAADAGDPLRAAHASVTAWVEEALSTLDEHHYYQDVDLKSLASGKLILDATPAQARDYVIAAVAQVRHWDLETDRVRAQGKTDIDRANAHMLPGWYRVWGRRRQSAAVLTALLRRSLPLSDADLLTLCDWSSQQDQLSMWTVPITSLTKAIERYAKTNTLNEPLKQAIRSFAQKLRASHDKDAKRAATPLEQLAGCEVESVEAEPASIAPVVPGVSGSDQVLVQLKQHLGLLAADAVEFEMMLPDGFRLRRDSPFREEHQLLSGLFSEVAGTRSYHSVEMSDFPTGKLILQREGAGTTRMLLAAAEREVAASLYKDRGDVTDAAGWQSRIAANSVVLRLLRWNADFDRPASFDVALYVAVRGLGPNYPKLDAFLESIVRFANESPLTEGERYTLWLLRNSLVTGPLLGSAPLPLVAKLNQLIADGTGFYLVPDEHWTLQVNADIHALPAEQRAKWVAALKHWSTATASRPSDKWLKTAVKLADEIGAETVGTRLAAWFAKMPSGRAYDALPQGTWDTRSGDVIHEENANCLRGMLWIAPTLKSDAPALTRAIMAVAQSAYKKIPGVGPRAVKVGNAAVYALSEIGTPDAVGQLAMLKVRVKFGTAQKEIEKAFNTAAEKLGLPRDEIEELGVPTYGLEEVGLRRETFGDAAAELRVDGREVDIRWTSGGKPVKSVPAKVKAEFKEDLKELQGAAKDIAGMLPAQSERLDSMFLLQKRWPVKVWQERYLDHPLIGTLARRLIWTDGRSSFIWADGKLVDSADQVVEPSADVRLWHPIDRPADEVLAWRAWLERHRVRQPFKQAHREIYLLTEAERRTNTYSNRFAAHILRQHQFNALCAARGWKNKLRLMVDDSYPPATRVLPNWNLRAEYWIEGIGDNYGTDTNDSGAFIRVATDQVRFYLIEAAQNWTHAFGGGYTSAAHGPGANNTNEPIPIERIPPLVLSEILRDVDLFVGVASVGNDPAWQDGGPGGRYREYWQSYSFGDLSETAQTRKSVLQTLLPRLTKLKDKWSLTEKFLVIQGSIRKYKIHLGSGNILMEPNDQYLCIVADRSSKATNEVFLPFEGDGTLSIILSKAFLLADDKKITDPTITRQLKI